MGGDLLPCRIQLPLSIPTYNVGSCPPLHYLQPPLPCQDLVIPCFKDPRHYRGSLYLGNAPEKRDILLFFRYGKALCSLLVVSSSSSCSPMVPCSSPPSRIRRDALQWRHLRPG